MEYNKIYSRFLSRAKPQDLLRLPEQDYYEIVNDYLHTAASDPMIRKLFSSISFD